MLFSEWSALFCSVLAARHGARVVYTPLIEEEAFRNLVRLGRISQADAVRLRAIYPQEIPATVLATDPSGYLADVRFVHEKDRPIAAAALQHSILEGQQVGLLTWNIRDFPRKPLLKKGVVRYTPDELAVRLSKLNSWNPFVLITETQARLQKFQRDYPQIEPTDFQQKARPWPESREQWADFLKRNRLLNLNSLIAKHPPN